MLLMFNDTETTGFPKNGVHARDPSQARVAQIALIITDEKGDVKNQFSSFLKPDGWEVSEGASKATGITTEMCHDLGISAAAAIEVFMDAAQMVDKFIAHNLAFDSKMMGIECEAWGHEFPMFDAKECTMLQMTPICKLAGRYNDYKWPKLEEAYKHCFGVDLEGAHDAMVDTKACMDVYFWLKKLEEKAA